MQSLPRIAVIFHRLGPYHFARLRVAGRQMPLVAIETSGADETYAWDLISGSDGFERKVLFPHADALKEPPHQVARRIRETLDEICPQVVVVPGWSGAASLGALQWSGARQIPVVVMSESTEWDEARSPWREAIKRRVVGLCSAALVGGNPHEDYIAKLGMPRERIFLGYDAVDNDYFAEKAAKVRSQKSQFRQQCRLPQAYFLASARFIDKKNLSSLIEAYARYRQLAKKAELWHLVLLGDGELRSDISHLICKLGLQHSVLLPGFIQYADLPAYYGLASSFIHASTTEQWGLVVNEAMASGLPVLVSNRCGCAQNLVQEGANGFTFDPYNVEHLAQLMLKISDINFPLSAFGSASREIIAGWGPERFTSGLNLAVEAAVAVSRPKVTATSKLLLKMLI